MRTQLVRHWRVVFVAISFCAANVEASILPESYALLEAPAGKIPVDPDFLKWLETYTGGAVGEGKPAKDLTARWKAEDDLTRQFGVFFYTQSGLNAQQKKEAVEKLLDLLVEYKKSNQFDHPLAPYVYEVVSSQTQIANETGPISCPHFRYIRDRITEKSFISTRPKEVNAYLERLKDSNAFEAVKETLKTFIYLLPNDKKRLYRDNLISLLKRDPIFLKRYDWLQGGDDSSGKVSVSSKNQDLVRVHDFGRRRRCELARSTLVKALGKKMPREDLEEALNAVTSVGACYRSMGTGQRLAAWQNLIGPMEKAFGVDAWGKMKVEIARFLWTADEYDKARAMLQEVLGKGVFKPGESAVHAQAILLEARIDENEGLLEEAIARYKTYLEYYSGSEDAELAQTALLLIYAGQEKWHETLDTAKAVIQSQGEQSVDERDVAIFGFALFWAGRAALKLGLAEEGLSYWKRVAAEYFSTYYGALGHYLLEQVTGKKYVLQPAKPIPFNPDMFAAAFPDDAGSRQRLDRIQTLLRLGMKESARCEARELKVEVDNPRQQLVQALFLHVAEDWLTAIRIFGNIPRTYRQTLPLGMERILFPKKYEKDVQEYAQKLSIDPDFVFSVIRQESVFNPNAQSGAGAKGLMQLLTKTAILEASKLGPNYVPQQIKARLMQKSRESATLFDTNSNLILGIHYLNSLLKKYGSTVVTLSAYNAGPTVAARWLRKYPSDDILHFIEKIPYKETRDYVKLIVRNYFYYKRWYDGSKSDLQHFENITESVGHAKVSATKELPI